MIVLITKPVRVLLVALLFVLISCAPTLAPAAPTTSMKGWELYSWQPENNQWRFVLVVGTNRLKTNQELLSDPSAVNGVERIKDKLAELQKGEQVFWAAPPDSPFRLPPPSIIQDLQTFLATRGVTLTVVEKQ